MNRYVILISIVGALGGLLFGFDTAVISGTLNFIQPYFGLTEAGLGWTVSSLLFGCIVGVFVAGKAGDRFGRKKILMLAAILFFISAIGSASSHTLFTFIAARVLGGLAVGVASILSPMYIAMNAAVLLVVGIAGMLVGKKAYSPRDGLRNWGELLNDWVGLPAVLGQLLIVTTAVLATTIKTTKH